MQLVRESIVFVCSCVLDSSVERKPLNQVVSAKWTFKGMTSTAATSQIASATYVAVPTTSLPSLVLYLSTKFTVSLLDKKKM